MSSKLSDVEKELARSAPMLNAKGSTSSMEFNVPGGELYWAVKDETGREYLSPEAAVAKHRGVTLEYGAARSHTIPWADVTDWDMLCVGGANSHMDNVRLARALEDVAEWLGYECVLAYVEDCRAAPETVKQLLKEAV